ncbi:MAG: hypothetical protein QF464_21735, partial [Myxococcota bacterium]|nr:hypothetical protein [Myxococcota bacterium]
MRQRRASTWAWGALALGGIIGCGGAEPPPWGHGSADTYADTTERDDSFGLPLPADATPDTPAPAL